MFPDDCLQSVVGADKWWDANTEKKVCRGALIWAFVPHVDQIPYCFEPMGRVDPTRHDDAVLRVSPLSANAPLKPTALPVAAMPLHPGEVWAGYRAKKRPCLVVGCNVANIDSELTRGKPKAATAPTLIAAPYYGATQQGGRAGYTPQFIERVRHCEYAQFLWDILPIRNGEESILRLDQIQPVGVHGSSYTLSDFRLSSPALEVIDEMLSWLIRGGVEEASWVALYREQIEATFGA
jgi:hypothetical protein